MHTNQSSIEQTKNLPGKDIFFFSTEIGLLKITTKDNNLLSLSFMDDDTLSPSGLSSLNTFQTDLFQQLKEYFEGKRALFDISLLPEGTSFEQDVWNFLLHIPFGQTASYGDIATSLGDMKKVRAVGRAVGHNPIPIIIPCHRIIGSNGHLIGFSGGLWRKKWLLKHEGAILL